MFFDKKNPKDLELSPKAGNIDFFNTFFPRQVTKILFFFGTLDIAFLGGAGPQNFFPFKNPLKTKRGKRFQGDKFLLCEPGYKKSPKFPPDL